MKKIFLSMVICLSIITISIAQHSGELKISKKKRDKWIKETTRELKEFSPDSLTPSIILSYSAYEDWQKLFCRVTKNGIIKLNSGDWIYIRTNSSHENEEIGDISIAIDSNKDIFKNEGHVCGGIINFETNLFSELKTTSDFFKYFVSDTDSATWEKIW
jgi:hypothetical protein